MALRCSLAPSVREAVIASFLSGTRLASFWERLRVSFWFLPSMLAATAFALSFLLVEIDRWLGAKTVREFGWLYTFGPEGARAVLSAIASSMITVAGLTFSITMLTLQLASSQFGPRMLRDFMRDRGNQVVLGVFIATFLYCLLVLRTVRGTEEASFTPHVAVAFGVFLALASLAVLIFFVHHVASSIRVETLLSELGRQALEAVDRLYPAQIGQGPCEAGSGTERHVRQQPQDMAELASERGGYVQRIDHEGLMRFARAHDLLLRIEAKPGDYAAAGATLLAAQGRATLSEELRAELLATVILGNDRTPHQDLELSLRRIVEIAQRALSPGINDPTTALYCIDRLQEALERLASRPTPAARRFDDEGRLRVIAPTPGFEALALPVFTAVSRYGLEDADVMSRLLDAMQAVADAAPPPAAGAVRALRIELAQACLAALRLPSDRARVRAHLA
jgi:uncharacterized membrane protein